MCNCEEGHFSVSSNSNNPKSAPELPGLLAVFLGEKLLQRVHALTKTQSFPFSLSVSNSAIEASTLMKSNFFKILMIEVDPLNKNCLELMYQMKSLESDKRPIHILFISKTFKADISKRNSSKATYLPFDCTDRDLQDFFANQISHPNAPAQASAEEPPAIDMQLVDVFFKGIQLVMTKSFNVPIKGKKSIIRNVQNDAPISADFGAEILLSSTSLNGSLRILMAKPVLLSFIKTVLGIDESEYTEECNDLLGEVCNQVYGYAKTVFNEKGFELSPQLPKLLKFEDGKASSSPDLLSIITWVDTELGQIVSELQLKKV